MFSLLNESDWNSMFSNLSNVNQLYPPKNDFPEKASPLALSIIAQCNEEGETLLSDHSNTLALLMDFKNTRGKETLAQQPFVRPKHHAGPKAFWMIIKSLSKQSSNIPMLSWDDSLATSDYNKANCLNNQFYNNFNHSYPHADTSSLFIINLTTVQPHLEYTSSVL